MSDICALEDRLSKNGKSNLDYGRVVWYFSYRIILILFLLILEGLN